MAAANIGSGGIFEATTGQTLYVALGTENDWQTHIRPSSGVYVAIVVSHIIICCLGTALLARLQTVYVVLNVL